MNGGFRPGSGPRRAGEGHLRRRGCLAAAVLIIVVRLVALNADPPSWLSWSTGIGTDEGFYTLDARHEVLFRHPAPGNFHDRLLSPLLSLLQQGVFTVFGPHLLTARLLCVMFGLLTVWVFWLGLRAARDSTVADAGALVLGLAPPFVFYNRMALQETPTVFWLVLALTLWAVGNAAGGRRRRSMLLVLSGAAFGIAFVFKPLALLALPAFVWLWRSPRATLPVGGALGVFLLYLLLWYGPHHAELSRMAAYYRVHQMQPHSFLSVWLNIRRGLVGGERGVLPYLLALMPVPLLLAGWGFRRGGDVGAFFGLWLGAGLLLCFCSSYAPSRYYVLFLPPLAGLAAGGWEKLGRPGRWMSVAFFLLTSGPWYGQAWAHRTFERQDAARVLTHLLPPGSVVIGEFAPALCLDTPFAAAPVQPGLSNSDRPVERLHATDIAVTRAPFWESWWRARCPSVIRPGNRVTTLTLGGPRHYRVDIYSVGPCRIPSAAQAPPPLHPAPTALG